jgi:hypothetical protein
MSKALLIALLIVYQFRGIKFWIFHKKHKDE